jgi:hypothetical protein
MSNGTYSGSYPTIHLSPRYPTITITATGKVSASGDAVAGGTAGAYTIDNFGAVYSSAADGIHLFDGGMVRNGGTAAYVAAYESAIVIAGAGGAIVNYGQIQSFGTGAFAGVALADGGSIDNAAGAVVEGYGYGVVVKGAVGTLTNTGTVEATGLLVGTPSDGLYLADGGAAVNSGSAAVIYGYRYGVALGASGTVGNDGRIEATGGASVGVELVEGGTVTDKSTGLIEGYGYGVKAQSGAATIVNYGTVECSGLAPAGTGIDLLAGGVVTNEAHALVSGYGYGISISGAAGTVANAGTVRSASPVSTAAAIELTDGGAIRNTAGAVIEGYGGIIVEGYAGTIANSGTIKGNGAYGIGILLGAGGVITNALTGKIQGYHGVEIYGAGTLVDYGTIAGTISGYSVLLEDASDLLVVGSGAIFKGAISGGGGTLELAGRPGTVTGLGGIATLSGAASGTFSGFGSYVIASGADWTLAGASDLSGGRGLTEAGTLAIAGTFQNDGVVDIAGGVMTDAAALTGTGTIALSVAGTLVLQSSASGTIAFADATGLLALGDPSGVTLAITGFGVGDTIDFTNVAFAASETVSYGDGELTIASNGTVVSELAVTSFVLEGGGVLGLQSDGATGTDIIVVPQPLVDSVGPSQQPTLDAAIQILGADVAATQGVTDPPLNIFTPAALSPPSGSALRPAAPAGAIVGEVNIANGAPETSGETITLAPKVQGIVLSGSVGAAILGHAANGYAATELLVGNAGNDTIWAGGGSGTIISGSGGNVIHASHGNVLVSSGGGDSIFTGRGNSTVQAYGSATVHAGAGTTTFIDLGMAGDRDKVHGGSGTTIMESGLGGDTFVGGSGQTQMYDTGAGNVAFQFDRGLDGTDLVYGFNSSAGDYIRITANTFTANGMLNHQTLVGGNTVVNLADGTSITFIGITALTQSDFHG